jgi:copper chaperone CopZ
MKCPHCNKEIKNPIASAGGKKSKRKITPAQQAKMQAARKKTLQAKQE